MFKESLKEAVDIANGINAVLRTQFDRQNLQYKLAFVDDGIDTGERKRKINEGIACFTQRLHLPKIEPARNFCYVNVPIGKIDRFGIDTELMPLNQVEVQGRAPHPHEEDAVTVLRYKQGTIMSRVFKCPMWRIADLLNKNGSNTYDGLPYFRKDHRVSPHVSSRPSETWSNDVECTAEQWDSGEGLVILRKAFADVTFYDGQKRGSAVKPRLLCSSNKQALSLGSGCLLSPSIIAVALPDMVEAVYQEDYLCCPAKYPGSDQYVYAFAPPEPEQAAIIAAIDSGLSVKLMVAVFDSVDGHKISARAEVDLTQESWPEIEAMVDGVADERVYIGWSWDGHQTYGYGLPHCCVRMKIGKRVPT